MKAKITGITVMIDSEIYLKCINNIKKVETIFYVTVLNDIYGIMKAEILFYRKFVGNITTI